MSQRPLSWRELIGGLLFALAAPAAAHDFWLQPAAFRVTADSVVPITLQVGHGPFRQRSPIPLRRIRAFAAIAPDGSKVDRRADLQLGGADADGAVRLSGAGTHVLQLETDDLALSRLPALRFNDYLQAEGLTPALEARARQQRELTEGSERYGRRAKALLQVGAATAGDAVTRPLGLTLEIVPELNPYAARESSTLPVRVEFEGAPLAGALVKMTDLAHDALPVETHVTDASGRAAFAMPRRGGWLLNVIWTKPLPAAAEADFETIFSSLSFGFD